MNDVMDTTCEAFALVGHYTRHTVITAAASHCTHLTLLLLCHSQSERCAIANCFQADRHHLLPTPPNSIRYQLRVIRLRPFPVLLQRPASSSPCLGLLDVLRNMLAY
jgi:hypothetical protein